MDVTDFIKAIKQHFLMDSKPLNAMDATIKVAQANCSHDDIRTALLTALQEIPIAQFGHIGPLLFRDETDRRIIHPVLADFLPPHLPPRHLYFITQAEQITAACHRLALWEDHITARTLRCWLNNEPFKWSEALAHDIAPITFWDRRTSSHQDINRREEINSLLASIQLVQFDTHTKESDNVSALTLLRSFTPFDEDTSRIHQLHNDDNAEEQALAMHSTLTLSHYYASLHNMKSAIEKCNPEHDTTKINTALKHLHHIINAPLTDAFDTVATQLVQLQNGLEYLEENHFPPHILTHRRNSLEQCQQRLIPLLPSDGNDKAEWPEEILKRRSESAYRWIHEYHEELSALHTRIELKYASSAQVNTEINRIRQAYATLYTKTHESDAHHNALILRADTIRGITIMQLREQQKHSQFSKPPSASSHQPHTPPQDSEQKQIMRDLKPLPKALSPDELEKMDSGARAVMADATAVRGLFHDLSVLVKDQQDDINRIDENTTQAAGHAKNGLNECIEAEKNQLKHGCSLQ